MNLFLSVLKKLSKQSKKEYISSDYVLTKNEKQHIVFFLSIIVTPLLIAGIIIMLG